LALPGAWAQARPESTRLSIAVAGKASFYYLPLTLAEQLGYFRAEGLDVEITDHAGWMRAQQAMVSGAADVCSGSFEHVIALQSHNQACQAFVLQGRAPQIAMGVSIRALPGYRTLADLKGRRIGISAPGSTSHLMAQRVLSSAGITALDVSYIGVGNSSGALAALRTGQIDAMSNVEPVMTMLEQKGEVRIISDARTLKGSAAAFGGTMPAACLYAPTEFIQRHPFACQALSHAIVHSLKWLQTAGPSDIIRTVPEAYLLGDRALYLASFANVREAFSLDGTLPPDGPRTAARALAGFDPDFKADRIDLARLYTPEFARRAKERFRV
jgi:NitT/TauT family transport system substrate-binding protein